MSNVGYATLTVLPVAKGFKAALSKEVSLPTEQAGRAAGLVGGKGLIAGFGGAALKVGGIAAGAVAAVGGLIGGLAVKGGISRQLQIEDAQAKLSGLGNSTAAVKQIMSDAMSSVKGTAFGMGEAATQAASAVAAGVKPGKDLERTLRLMGDTATIAGTSMGEMGFIFNKVAASNKLQGDSIAMLQDRGIPVLQFLGKTLNKTSEEVSKMASDGKIDFATFQKAMEQGLGGAALKSGDTTRGAFANMKAAFSRLGVALTSWFMPLMKDVFNAIGSGVDFVTKLLNPLSAKFGEVFQGKVGPILKNARKNFDDMTKGAGGSLQAFTAAFTEANGEITSSGFNGFMERMGNAAGQSVGGLTALQRGFQGLPVAGGPVIQMMASIGSAVDSMIGGWQNAGAKIEAGGLSGAMMRIGQTGRQVFDALGQVFSSVGPQLLGLVPQILQVVSAFNPLGLVFQALLPVLPTLVGLFGQLVTAGVGLLAQVLPPVTALLTQVVSTLSGVFVAILPTIVQAVTSLAGIFATLAPVIGNIVGALAPLIASLVESLAPILVNLITTILPPVVSIFSSIATAIGPVVTTIAGLLIPIIQALLPVVTQVFGVIAQVIGAAMQIVQGIIQVVTGIISGNWAMVWSGIQNIVGGIWNGIVAVVTGAIGLVGSIIRAGLGVVSAVWNSVWGAISGFFSGLWSGITGAVSAGISNIVSFFQGLPGKILGALAGLGGSLLQVGRDMIQGLINGVGGMIDSAVQAVKNVGGAMLDGIKGFLGIHSPSREFIKIGAFVMQGLTNGVRKNSNSAVQAMRSVAQRVTDAATAHFNKARSSKTKKGRAAENLLGHQLDSVADVIRKDIGRLGSLISKRDSLASRLKDSQKKLASAISTRDKQAADSAKSLLDGFKLGDLVGQDAGTIVQAAKDAAGGLKTFGDRINTLRKMGLSAGLIEQIGDLGVAKGTSIADSLIGGGKGAISQLNSAYGKIGSLSKSTGLAIANGMYGAGIDAMRGLVNGLTKNKSALDKAIKGITDRMTAQVRKNLGIHSPSRVFRGFGVNVGEGLVLGIEAMQPGVERAVGALSDVAAGASFAAPDVRSGVHEALTTAAAPSVVKVYVGNEELDARTYRVAQDMLRDEVRKGVRHRPGVS